MLFTFRSGTCTLQYCSTFEESCRNYLPRILLELQWASLLILINKIYLLRYSKLTPAITNPIRVPSGLFRKRMEHSLLKRKAAADGSLFLTQKTSFTYPIHL